MATPRDYGLKVQSHPVLLVTSPLKMRTARPLSLSYSGSLIQTVSFLSDHEALKQEPWLREDLGFKSMGDPHERGPSGPGVHQKKNGKGHSSGGGIQSGLILEFLQSYLTPQGADRANSSVLAEFVSRMNEAGELHQWTVALLAEGRPGPKFDFSSQVSISSFPSRTDSGVIGRYYSIGVLTDPDDEGIDLRESEWRAALAATRKEWKPDPARNRLAEPTRPSGLKIREQRGFGLEGAPQPSREGLLMIYPLSPDGAKMAVADWQNPIVGFAISFPSSNTGVRVDYKVDHLFWETEYGSAD